MPRSGSSIHVANNKILMIEDDQRFGELQRDFLHLNGFDVKWIQDGREAEEAVAEFQPQLVLLDLMLPGLSGFDICRKIRTRYTGIILFLSASEDDIDHVACLELGGDDFVNKPIRPRVLLARIHMLLRRADQRLIESNPKEPDVLTLGELSLKRKSRDARLGPNQIKLTASEFNLLWLLAKNPDEIMERAFLFQELRGIEFDGLDRSVDTKIVSLRKKLNDTDEVPKRIVTVRNKGYLLASDAWGK